MEQHLQWSKGSIPTLTLTLAWLGSGGPAHVEQSAKLLLAALLGCAYLPWGKTPSCRLAHFPSRAIRAAVATGYQADTLHRPGLVSAKSSAHQRPWAYVISLRRIGPAALARLYRRRWQLEPILDEVLHDHDLGRRTNGLPQKYYAPHPVRSKKRSSI